MQTTKSESEQTNNKEMIKHLVIKEIPIFWGTVTFFCHSPSISTILLANSMFIWVSHWIAKDLQKSLQN